MKTRLFAVVAILALAALACELPFSNTSSGSAPSGGTSGGGAASDPGLLFQDDFSDVNSGWDRSTFDDGLTDYANGEYRMLADADNYSVWANPSRDFTDVSVTVTARKGGGPDDNEFGIICRYTGLDDFYVAVISSDGFYAFLRLTDREWNLLNMDGFDASDVINQGAASNTIRLDCIGDTLTLYANGQQLGQTTDSSLSSGDVGLYVGTFSEPGADIYFDNFVVRQP